MKISLKIKTLAPEFYAEWDAYVNRHLDGTFFHLSGWKTVLEKAYEHKTCYLLAERYGRIVGIMPLAQIRSRLFGNALISNPFCVYGGAVADDDETRELLETAAEGEAIRLNVDYLELRNINQTRSDWPVKDLYVAFRSEERRVGKEGRSRSSPYH